MAGYRVLPTSQAAYEGQALSTGVIDSLSANQDLLESTGRMQQLVSDSYDHYLGIESYAQVLPNGCRIAEWGPFARKQGVHVAGAIVTKIGSLTTGGATLDLYLISHPDFVSWSPGNPEALSDLAAKLMADGHHAQKITPGVSYALTAIDIEPDPAAGEWYYLSLIGIPTPIDSETCYVAIRSLSLWETPA